MKIPMAKTAAFNYEIHGYKIKDEYAWMRDENCPKVESPEILEYLNAENEYFSQFFAPLSNTKQELFAELKGRIKLTDQSTYTKKDAYYYYSRTEEDKEYTIFCRKYNSTEASEEVILDVNQIAAGNKFTKIGTIAVSPDHKLLAYSVDFTGGEKFVIRILNLESGIYLPDNIEDTIGNIVWYEDGSGFFYTPVNEVWRHDKVMFHYLGKDEDRLVHHEPNHFYQLNIFKSGSRRYVFINSDGHDSNEIYALKMDDHDFGIHTLTLRKDSVFLSVDHRGDYFFVKNNDNAKNFKVERKRGLDGKIEPYILESEYYLSSFDISANYITLNYRDQGVPLIKIKHLDSGQEKIINFPDPSFVATGSTSNFEEDDLRITYSSLARPATVFSYDFLDNTLSVLKEQEIPSGFNKDEYVVERIFAASKDGVKVPISLFYKKSLFKKDGSNPLYLYGYGSYGISTPANFRSTAVSLANRGFVFAIAHIRGGDDLGHDWYEAAKFLTKKRTFEDFIASAEALVNQKYTRAGNIVICGGSAGGLLIGVAINEKPELFKAAIAHVPFVDVLNTMLDETLPLTPGEFKEWGNPQDKEYFEYMLSYSPYDNVKPKHYPALMVTAGLTDPRVGYWEAAKWVARIRKNQLGDNPIIFKTNMDAGHQGASGRFDYLKEVAEDLAFIFEMAQR